MSPLTKLYFHNSRCLLNCYIENCMYYKLKPVIGFRASDYPEKNIEPIISLIWFVINVWINYLVKSHWPGRDGQNLSGIFAEYITIFNNRRGKYIKEHVCFFNISVSITSWIRVFLNISSSFKPCFLSWDYFEYRAELFHDFCRIQNIWRHIFAFSHSWQQSTVTLQYRAVQTRAFLGKEGVYTLVYPATKILIYWGFKFGDTCKKYIVSSDKKMSLTGHFFLGKSETANYCHSTQGMLQNSKETKAKACRSLSFWSTFSSPTLSKLKNKPIWNHYKFSVIHGLNPSW